MKIRVTPEESSWLNVRMGQLQQIAAVSQATERMAFLANKIRYQTDGFPPLVNLTREQRALARTILRERFKSLDLIPCQERDIVVSLLQKVVE